MIRRARLRMFALAHSPIPGSVEAWDQRTSMDDARIALQLALGYPVEQIGRQGYLLAQDGAA